MIILLQTSFASESRSNKANGLDYVLPSLKQVISPDICIPEFTKTLREMPAIAAYRVILSKHQRVIRILCDTDFVLKIIKRFALQYKFISLQQKLLWPNLKPRHQRIHQKNRLRSPGWSLKMPREVHMQEVPR